jgi:hypothetical protein
LFHGDIKDASKEMLQRYVENKEELYGKIEREMEEVHQVVQLVHAVPTTPSSSQTAELGYEPSQLRILADAIEALLQRV